MSHSPLSTYRSLNEHTPASVVASSYGTPRSTRTPRALDADSEQYMALRVASEDVAFAEKCRRSDASASEAAAVAKEAFSAARHGDRATLETLLGKEGGEGLVKMRDEHGNSLFIVACQNGHKKIGKLLLEKKADVKAQNARGNTGLHFLFAYGYAEMAEYFIAKFGADPEIKNELGLTARQGIKFLK